MSEEARSKLREDELSKMFEKEQAKEVHEQILIIMAKRSTAPKSLEVKGNSQSSANLPLDEKVLNKALMLLNLTMSE